MKNPDLSFEIFEGQIALKIVTYSDDGTPSSSRYPMQFGDALLLDAQLHRATHAARPEVFERRVDPPSLEQRVQARALLVATILSGVIDLNSRESREEEVVNAEKYADIVQDRAEAWAAKEVAAEADAELADHRTAQAEDERLAVGMKAHLDKQK